MTTVYFKLLITTGLYGSYAVLKSSFIAREMSASQHQAPIKAPRVAITYCTQCRWMLRAAYLGQELLSTFGTSIGEVALIPATGGVFTIFVTHARPLSETESSQDSSLMDTLVWDRKADGGFPEAKVVPSSIRKNQAASRLTAVEDLEAKNPKPDRPGASPWSFRYSIKSESPWLRYR